MLGAKTKRKKKYYRDWGGKEDHGNLRPRNGGDTCKISISQCRWGHEHVGHNQSENISESNY